MPNLTLGPPVIQSLHAALPRAFLDCHLMVADPQKWIAPMHKAGASLITVHVESAGATQVTLDMIHATGVKAGLALSPPTPLSAVLPFLPSVSQVLVMTVQPGFVGCSVMVCVSSTSMSFE